MFFFEGDDDGDDGVLLEEEDGWGDVCLRVLKVLIWGVDVQKQHYQPMPKIQQPLHQNVEHHHVSFLPDTILTTTASPTAAPAPVTFGPQLPPSQHNLLANNNTASSLPTQDIYTEASSVARQCLFLFGLILSSSMGAKLLPLLFDDSNKKEAPCKLFSDAVASSLIKSPSDDVRSLALTTFRSIYLASSSTQDIDKTDRNTNIMLLNVLVKLLPLKVNSGEEQLQQRNCCRLFYLVGDILSNIWNDSSIEEQKLAIATLQEHLALSATPPSNPPSYSSVASTGALLHYISHHVTTLPIYERRRTPNHVDYYLVGLLKLADRILKLLPMEAKDLLSPTLLPHLFHNTLFNLPHVNDNESLSPPQAKAPQTREAAYTLLTTLSSTNRTLSELTTLLSQYFHNFQKPPRHDLSHEWNSDPFSRDKNPSGYVGLKNLGATCYLNSLLQQLFFIRDIRERILGLENRHDSALLHELQVLFANLACSERRDYDTSALCEAIKGYDGNSIRPGEQQDVEEFFNLFAERFESETKNLTCRNSKKILQNVFGGQICHVILCKYCQSKSERKEDCLSLSLDVKGKRSIQESLSLYIKGESLDGDNKYFCETCAAKKDSLKMACVSVLPNVLILHLKRFEFDLECMRKIKVNDRCEFPMVLNMRPYTREGVMGDEDRESGGLKEDAYYIYQLRGVLVHSGTADSGHYYSLTKTQDGKWFCFNDSSVTPFDVATLPTVTFGGVKASNKFDDASQKMIRTESAKPYSAYLLIYERDYAEDKKDFNKAENINEMNTSTTEKNQEIFTASKKETATKRDEEKEVKEDNASEKNVVILDEPIPVSTSRPEPTSEEQFSKKGLSNTDIALNTAITTSCTTSSPLRTNSTVTIMPPSIYKHLWHENDLFLRDLIFYSTDYSHFLLSLTKISCSQHDTTKKTTQLAITQIITHYTFDFLIHAKDRKSTRDAFIDLLCKRFEDSSEACLWMLQVLTPTITSTTTAQHSYHFWCDKIFLKCSDVMVRRDFVKVLRAIFLKMSVLERGVYNLEIESTSQAPDEQDDGEARSIVLDHSEDEEDDDDMDDDESCDVDDDIIVTPINAKHTSSHSESEGGKGGVMRIGRAKWWKSQSVLARFVGMGLLELLVGCESHWRRFDQLFECIEAFVMCGHDEALYMIRCGLVLRLIDIYLGDSGGVPQKSLLTYKKPRHLKTRQRRPKMGDKYTKLNFYPLLSLLSLLIRSVTIIPDEDDASDDDTSDADSIPSTKKIKAAITPTPSITSRQHPVPPTLTTHCQIQSQTSLTRFELPRRDAALVSTKKFLQSLFEEPTSPHSHKRNVTNHFAVNNASNNTSLLSTSQLISQITSHISFGNLETTRQICSISQRLLEDRKADEFQYCLDTLLALLKLNDTCIEERCRLVMMALCAGVTSNLPYEKESTVILHGLRDLVLEMMGNRKRGIIKACDVVLHNWLLENLKSQFIDEWFLRTGTSIDVRISIIGVMKALRPLNDDEISHTTAELASFSLPFNEGTKKRPVAEAISPTVGGSPAAATTAATSTLKRRRRGSNISHTLSSPAVKLNHVATIIETTNTCNSNNIPKLSSSPFNPISGVAQSSSFQIVDDDDSDDVVILGVVNNPVSQTDEKQGLMTIKPSVPLQPTPNGNKIPSSNTDVTSEVSLVSSSRRKIMPQLPPQSNMKTADPSSSLPTSLKYQNSSIIYKLLYTNLISLFSEVNDTIRSQTSQNTCHKQHQSSSSTTRNNSSCLQYPNSNSGGGYLDTTVFADFFETLRHCLVGERYESNLFLYSSTKTTKYLSSSSRQQRALRCHHGIHLDFANLLWKIDEEGRAEQRPSADYTKGEMILFYEKMILLHPEVGDELVANFELDGDGATTKKQHSSSPSLVVLDQGGDCVEGEDPFDDTEEMLGYEDDVMDDDNDDSAAPIVAVAADDIVTEQEDSSDDVAIGDYINGSNKRSCKRFRSMDSPPTNSTPPLRKKEKKKHNGKLLPPTRHQDGITANGTENDSINHVSKLLEVFVTSVRGNEIYNAKYMSHYYNLLRLLADRNKNFKRRLLEHNNWRWSLRAFVLGHTGCDSGPLYDVIFGGILRHVEDDSAFRHVILSYLAAENCEGGKRSLLTQSRLETSGLKLVIKIFECDRRRTSDSRDSNDEENLIANFVDEPHRGLSQLSTCVEKFHRSLEEECSNSNDTTADSKGSVTKGTRNAGGGAAVLVGTSTAKTDIILEGLALSLECLCFILNAYGMNQVRSLMSSNWPEVDDMNFICTQIVTRTQDEWDSCLDESSVKSRVESMRVVEHASELLKILASAEVVAEVEAE